MFFSIAELLKYTEINNHSINLVDDKEPLHSLIYNLGSVALELLKTYIETNLANDFIQLFQLSTNILILFIKKKNGSFQLCVNYRDFNTWLSRIGTYCFWLVNLSTI